MTSALLSRTASLATDIAKLTDLDKLLHITYALDHLSAIVDDEPQATLQNALSDIQGTMIEACDEILESGDERLIAMMENSEGFQAAYELRQAKIKKDAERDRARKQWESFLLKKQVA